MNDVTDHSNLEVVDRPLRRVEAGRMAAGVANGLARYFDLDVTIVRLGFVLLGLFGVGVPLYIAGWLLMPDDETNESVAADLLHRHLAA